MKLLEGTARWRLKLEQQAVNGGLNLQGFYFLYILIGLEY